MINWSHYESYEELLELARERFVTEEDIKDELSLVELIASDTNNTNYVDSEYVDSENTLSRMFDDMIMSTMAITADQYSKNDAAAFNAAFNNWSHELCQSGIIHISQYNDYCYVK